MTPGTSTAITAVMSGAIAMEYAVAGLFFLRFWRDTRDRLFAVFAIAFFMLGVQRLLLATTTVEAESRTGLYLVRLAAFMLILLAILGKNRRAGG
jgi:uncharacterized membrane protein YeiB